LAVRVCRRCATLFTRSADEAASCHKHTRAPVPYDAFIGEHPEFELAESGAIEVGCSGKRRECFVRECNDVICRFDCYVCCVLTFAIVSLLLLSKCNW
jgi:hypothetical protein